MPRSNGAAGALYELRVANAFAGAANISSISVQDMASAMAYAGPAAAALGFSLEDTSAAIAVLGANGIKGSSAGTGLLSALNTQPWLPSGEWQKVLPSWLPAYQNVLAGQLWDRREVADTPPAG